MKPMRRWLVVVGILAVDALHPPRVLRPTLEEELGPDTLLGPPLAHQWQLVDGDHWQIVSQETEDPTATDAAEQTTGACPSGMAEVQGEMKVEPPSAGETLEELQEATCTEWISREFPERCAKFDRGKWILASNDLSGVPVHFCIDRFEYPNRRGAYPLVLITWHEAAAVCAREGKRLCTETEWTFACEGPEAMPYPYGYERNPEACVIDRPWRQVDELAFGRRTDSRALRELDRLWQGEPSGSHRACRSVYGVYDMTGNVDEWTASSHRGERPSVLKGGYWGPVRAMCRASTRAHDADFAFYQIGFRCCADVPAAPPLDGGEGVDAGERGGDP